MHRTLARLVVAIGILGLTPAAIPAATPSVLPGGGSKRTDCIVQLASPGTPFPGAGKSTRGLTCRDGDACDGDGLRNGVCRFDAAVCVNMATEALPRCTPSDVARVTVGRNGRGRKRAPASPLAAATGGLTLPSTAPQCSAPAAVNVAVSGPDRRGEFRRGTLDLRLQARTSRGKVDRDRYRLVCLPAGVADGPPTPPPPPPVTPTGTPGAGLQAEIVGATLTDAGTVTVTLRLTDGEGVPITPVRTATTDPNRARVRLTIARLERQDQTQEGFTTTFTRYVNYVTTRATAGGQSSDQPTYDASGSFAAADAAAGTFVYTFAIPLPPDWAARHASLTHTIGAQIERAYQGATLVANPVFDFVPAGGAVTTVREPTTTAQCNACHGELRLHGGGRREVRLCQLCHTDQATDPDTGNTLGFENMVHRIHRGKDLPGLEAAVGRKYAIVGFNREEHVYGARVRFCSGGQRALTECHTDADCGAGSTCVDAVGATTKTIGVGFPQDIRNCAACHGAGATSADHRERPSAAACASCHDDVNPGTAPLNGLAPGTNHLPGAVSDALCQVCHTPTGPEFGISVAGAHTIPLRSAQLRGIRADILSAVAQPGGAVRLTFRVTDDAGVPYDRATLCGFGRLAFAMSGPGPDLGSRVLTQQVTLGGSCALPTPDGSGAYTIDTSGANVLPGGATGVWRVGIEVRRSVELPVCVGGPRDGLSCATEDCMGGTCGLDVEEAAQNDVLDFSVDGTPLAERRTVVAQEQCARCHGTFSKDISVHGNLRNQVEYCVVCHNPNASDHARRAPLFCAVTCGPNRIADTTAGAGNAQLVNLGDPCAAATTCVVAVTTDTSACLDDASRCVSTTTAAGDDVQSVPVGRGAPIPTNENIGLKHMLHRIHTGEHLERTPFIVYGFGGSANDFGDVLYPNDRRRCAACHASESHLLPLAEGLLPTRVSQVFLATDPNKPAGCTAPAGNPFAECEVGSRPPLQGACVSCHDGAGAEAHADTNTSASGGEACVVCHGETRIAPVSGVHAVE
jgi:hypothetical protein